MRIKLNNKTSDKAAPKIDIPIYIDAQNKENVARYEIEEFIQSVKDEIIDAIADTVIDHVICHVIEQQTEEIIDAVFEQEPEEIIDAVIEPQPKAIIDVVIEQESCGFNTIETEDLAKSGNCEESDCVDLLDEYEEESDFSDFE